MKSKTIIFLLSLTFLLSGCGSKVPAETKVSETQKETEQAEVAVEKDDVSDSASLSDIEVEKELFDVTIEIPADFVQESTQKELDAQAAEYGYKAVLNDDGSAVFIMTKSQYNSYMEELSKTMTSELENMIGSEEYPNITDIEANSDYTEFTVTTKNIEIDMSEAMSVIIFYAYGGMYGIFNGKTPDNISVTFVNADSGEIISTANSSDM